MSVQHPGYLDAAATAELRPEAEAAILEALRAGQANPSSVHSAGHRAGTALDEARATVARALGARPSEVVFTSGGSEANNLAVIGLALASSRGKHLITTEIEHPSVREACEFLVRRLGFELTALPVDSLGRLNPEAVREALRPDTALVTVGLANAEVGTVQPIGEISAVVREAGALLHTDAVQAAAALPVSFGSARVSPQENGPAATRGHGEDANRPASDGWPGFAVDAMSVASHKFGGPQGAGALLLRTGIPIEPLIHGGGQEGGARSGTENLLGLAGFAAAVQAAALDAGTRALGLLSARDSLIARVIDRVPGARLTGDPMERLPGHASFVVEGVSGESLLVALDAAGFAVSSGSACAAGQDEPSPVLLALGYDPDLARTAIRFTFDRPLAEAAIDRIAEVLRREVLGAR
ncbi:cysteine desulfurase [Leucobacter sp. CSA2]|uniref:Cysteine desulfurase n=1 Tax=Leucobacter edaphi TaxID=2796472 RepID=A0A934QE45_9MICO|nr:cysteine desulfurase [Leucobacter edaphi]